MTCQNCKRETDRRTIAEASARRWEDEAKALRREIRALRMSCDTQRLSRRRDTAPGNSG